MELDTITLTVTAVAVFFVLRILKFARDLGALSYLPGLRPFFEPLNFPGALFPSSSWSLGVDFAWVRRHDLYKIYNAEMVSIIPLLMGRPYIVTSNIDVARQVVAAGYKACWERPPLANTALLFWGMNLVASDGENWRKHRRIMGPAFNSRTYALVWENTRQTYYDMVAHEGWTGKDVVHVPIVQKLTTKLALLIIGSCGFGFPFTWSLPATTPDSKMAVQEALCNVCGAALFMSVAPNWAFKLPFEGIQRIATSVSVLRHFMHEQVDARRQEIRAELAAGDSDGAREDVFSTLVRANELEGKDKLKLDDNELIGNIFVLLFAGHETTASTLAATLGMLAINPDIQEEVVEQIVSVAGQDRDPTFDDFDKLNKVTAAFYEGSRMFPAGSVLLRENKEDTVLTVPNPLGEDGQKTFPVPRGTLVVTDMIGIHYNPRYFENPEVFQPSRWYGKENDAEAATSFSFGPRSCIGRKFATTEGVCFLALVLRDWRVEPILRAGESNKEWQERVMNGRLGLSMTLLDIPLSFVRRKRA